LFVFLVMLFFSHWLCSFCVVFFPWLTSCYSFCIGLVVFFSCWCYCLSHIGVVAFSRWWCSLRIGVHVLSCWCCYLLVLVFLPFPHWYCYACHISFLAFPTLVLLILLHRWCSLSYIVLLLLSHWSYYFYRIDVGTRFTLVLCAQGPIGSIFIVVFLMLVLILFPWLVWYPPPSCTV
jgi:hypothetical protein